MQTMLKSAVVLAACLVAAGATAKPRTYVLPDADFAFNPGPGAEAASNNCLSCHSGDYVKTQPPQRGKAFWEAEVTKMIKVYHATIADSDAKAIAEYLAGAY